MADLPGGTSGLLVRGYKGEEWFHWSPNCGHGSDLPGKAFGACFR
jgi:hypothetical protein